MVLSCTYSLRKKYDQIADKTIFFGDVDGDTRNILNLQEELFFVSSFFVSKNSMVFSLIDKKSASRIRHTLKI